MASGTELNPAFKLNTYLFRRKVFKFFGGEFKVYDEDGREVLHSKQKAFKLKEDFRVYSVDLNQELLTIKTPQILDIGATYNVVDATTGEAIGSLRRKGLKSIIKDEWLILSDQGQEIGKIAESSMLGAFMSRFIDLVPQTYNVILVDGTYGAQIKQHFNPFVLKYTMKIFEQNPGIDRRLLLSAGILLAGIERRQN
ncbi:MAG: hypothetical protein HOC20_00565 [Chloroflexi bacterium]|jgi:uncharacterized protein YxjI|nr:hypothetical protein [Chloroflexota bacterium]